MIVQFREGEREIPDYLAALMASFETYRFTYEEALAKVNSELVNDLFRKEMNRVTQDHFKKDRR